MKPLKDMTRDERVVFIRKVFSDLADKLESDIYEGKFLCYFNIIYVPPDTEEQDCINFSAFSKPRFDGKNEEELIKFQMSLNYHLGLLAESLAADPFVSRAILYKTVEGFLRDKQGNSTPVDEADSIEAFFRNKYTGNSVH